VLASQHIARLEFEIEGLEGHGAVVFEVFATNSKKNLGGLGAADAVEEIAGGLDTDADVVEIFFDFLNVRPLGHAGRMDGFE